MKILLSTTSTKDFLFDVGPSFDEFKGMEERTFTTSRVDGEKEGFYNNTLPNGHILDLSISRDAFKKNGGTLTISVFDQQTKLSYNTKADCILCPHCRAPTTSTLTNGDGIMLYVCQRLSEEDFGLLVLTAACSRFVLITDDCCLGWSTAKTGSVGLEKNVIWSDYYKNV